MDQRDHGRTVASQEHEYTLPGEYQQQHAAEGGCHRRRQGHQHGDKGQGPGRARGAKHIPGHGSCQGGAHAGAYPLQEAEQQQLLHCGGQAAAYAGRHKQRGANDQYRLATEAIRQGAAGQVEQGKTREVAAQGQVHMADIGVEGPHHDGHGGQVHIDTEGAQRHQGCQQGQ